MSDKLTEPRGMDRANLLSENSGRIVVDENLGAKRCWSSTARRWRDQDHGPGKQLIGLHDHAEPSPPLLMTDAPREPKLVDVTAAHAGSP